MGELLLDTSVLLKWFHRMGEEDIEQAEWHLQAHHMPSVVVWDHIWSLFIRAVTNWHCNFTG